MQTRIRAITILLTALLVSTTAQAVPDPETGAGCAKLGVAETVPIPASNVRFNPINVRASQIDELCNNKSRAVVWGCYFPDGTAYLVGNSKKVYWHEWCHAKFGPAHANAGRGKRNFTAQRLVASI